MAYVFDPTTNTLIDDEDKSLGNKLALNQDEFLKLLEIPGVFRASEAPQPPPRPDVQDIDAINRFMRDNPVEKAEGGRINFGDGSITKVQNKSKNVTGEKLTLFNEGKLYHLRLGADKINYYGTKEQLEKIFKNRKTSGGARNIPRDIPEGFVTGEEMLKAAKEKNIFVSKGRDPNNFANVFDFPKEMVKGKNFYDISKLEIPNEVDKILKSQVISGSGTDFAKKKFPIKTKSDIAQTRYEAIEARGGVKKDSPLAGKRKLKVDMGHAGNIYSLFSDELITLDKLTYTPSEINEIIGQPGNIDDKIKAIQKSQFKIINKFNDADAVQYMIQNDIDYDAMKGNFKKQLLNKSDETLTGLTFKSKGNKAVRLSDGTTFGSNFLKNPVDPLDMFKGVGELEFKNFRKQYLTNEGNLQRSILSKEANKKRLKINLANTDDIPKELLNKNITKKQLDDLTKLKFFEMNRVASMEAASKNVKKKYNSILTNRLNSGIPIDNILSTIANDLNIPVEQIKKVAGKTLKTFGKATGVVEPVFAALDAGEAFREGLSGKQAANYVVGRFFEGLVNLPALAKGGFDFAVDKARGKDAKFEMPYEATFAQDYKDRVLEQTPEEILEARKAKLEFDQTVRPGMTMVDDIDIPESKAEIEAAKNLFMDEKGIDLSVLDEPKPDKTFSQFLANGGRVGFSNGGAAGADENFAAELEYFLTNEDAELPKMQTYKETMNPIEVLNDIIDPRNYPYYADVLARSGVRIGEFATRILPATGKLINDLITKPAFKITGTGNNYVQDYTDILPSNIKGTGIFSEFLENITPTTLEKKVGLDKLIEKEEQKLKDRGSTAGPKVFADTVGLGTEVTAPIFPGLKLLNAYAKSKNLPVNDVTQKLLVKEVDEVLEKQGMDRRTFLQMTGAGATVILAKMLGFGDEVARTAKVAEKATEVAAGGVPPYFFDLVEIIKKKGVETTKKNATKNLENVYSYKDYDVYEDLATGEIRVEKTNMGANITVGEDGIKSREMLEYKPGRGDESTTGTPPDEFDQATVYPDAEGKLKDLEEGEIDIEEILEFIKNEKIN